MRLGAWRMAFRFKSYPQVLLFQRKNIVCFFTSSLTDELQLVLRKYQEVGLPGCMGSKDVIHVKWSCAPSRDFNRCKGKESYRTIAFQCVSNFERRIQGVSRAQYGTRNDKSLVKQDHNVHAVPTDWYSQVEWEYLSINGEVRNDVGCYLICDNGYLCWPTFDLSKHAH